MSHPITKQEIKDMDEETLNMELAFAEGFSPPVTPDEQEWIDELRAEKERRRVF